MALILSSDEAKKIAKDQAKRNDSAIAEQRQSRIRIHSEELERIDVIKEPGFHDTVHMVTEGLSEKKFNRIKEFIQYPIATISIVDEIKKKIGRVFEGRDSNIDVTSSNPSAQTFIDEMEDIGKFVKKTSFKALYGEFNAIVIVDKPIDSDDPFQFLLDVSNVVDYQICDGEFDYIAFEIEREEKGLFIAVYDSTHYRVFKVDGNNVETTVESPHSIGYCPALFYNEKVYNDDEFQRIGLLNAQKGELSNYFLFNTYQIYTDHYVPFPVVEHPEIACGNPECDNGMVTKTHNDEIKRVHCHECKNQSIDLVAPGSMVEVVNDDEGNTTSGLLRFIQPETSGLEYINTRQEVRRAQIIKSITGSITLPDNKALNEIQVAASFEQSNRIINAVKTNLERVHKWLVVTKVLAKFGKVPVSANVNYGTVFFIKSANDLLNELQRAKEQNLPQNELTSIYTMYLETKHRSNPMEKERQLTLASLEPFPFYAIEEINKFPAGILTAEDLQIKLRFNELINRFELENGNIVNFGIEKPKFEKIKTVKETIKSYINENGKSESLRTGGQGIEEN